MPTSYPKCSPNELMGLLVLVNDHRGSEDVAILAGDLDLEIDEIFPSLEYAEVLGLLKVVDGRASLTDGGRRLLAGSIRDRKTLLREQLRRTTLFKAIMRALENAPGHQMTEEEMVRLIAFTTAPADEYVQNIINWGRYAELFRFDADAQVLTEIRRTTSPRTSTSGSRPPPGIMVSTSPRSSRSANAADSGAEERLSSAAQAAG